MVMRDCMRRRTTLNSVTVLHVHDSSADEMTAEPINAADVHVIQDYNGDDVETDGRLLEEARLWNAARLLAIADDDDAEVMELPERLRRSRTGLQAPQNSIGNREDDVDDGVNHEMENCEQKRRRRPPVDPTLLMMGIGKRK